MSSEPEAPAAEVEEAPPVDEKRQALLDALTAELGDAVVGSEVAGGDVWVRVATDRWHDAAAACKHKLDMDYFCFLSGIDWLDEPAMSGEKVWGALPEEEEGADDEPAGGGSTGRATGVAGGDTRFQLLLRVASTTSKLGVTLKTDLDEAEPRAQSITDVYRGADWHERETWEMYGFDFVGHPGLRHIYLPGGFEGHPLRKDFPLLAREVKPWPGLVDVEPLPGGGDEEAEAAE
ncbi:MAG TPA: NADH-quinone oxidoreductase subunit C [Acidimicrobiales bacterium]|nr:NADH-quinone oxidoreductase subunit C [Acidimicrobiales bacterium]